jgi:hypothetical protein
MAAPTYQSAPASEDDILELGWRVQRGDINLQ